MKLEVKSIRMMPFAMAGSVPGALLGLVIAGAAAFLYPFESAGAGTLVGTVLGGTAGGALLGFLLGLVSAWSYNAFSALAGGIEVELKETEKDE